MKTRTTATLLASMLLLLVAVPKAKADGDDHWGFNLMLNSPGYAYQPYGWYYTPPPPPPVIRYRAYYYPYHNYYYRPYRPYRHYRHEWREEHDGD